MGKSISHKFEDETPDAKALWFQSLPLEERMDMLCMFTDMILEANPRAAEHRHAKSTTGTVKVLKRA